MADGTIDTEKRIATETYVYKERKIHSQIGSLLNCLYKLTLNETKQKDAFHQLSSDPYSLDDILKYSEKHMRLPPVFGHYAAIFTGIL